MSKVVVCQTGDNIRRQEQEQREIISVKRWRKNLKEKLEHKN